MRLLRRLFDLLRKPAASRFAWLFTSLHGAWFLLVIANMSPPSKELAEFLDDGGWSSVSLIAGRPFHLHDGSVPLRLLILVDLPSLLASNLFFPGRVTTVYTMGFYEASYVEAALWLLTSSVQWLVIGSLFEHYLESVPQSFLVARRFKRYIPVTIVLVIACTAILVPIINARSQRLWIQHGKTSSVPGELREALAKPTHRGSGPNERLRY